MHLEFIRAKGKELPVPAHAAEVTSIRVWYCSFRSLDCLREFVHLRRVIVAGYPEESLSCLEPLAELEELDLVHLPKVRSLEPLTALSNLRQLSLATAPSWEASRKRLRVASLLPLASLSRLESLALLGVVPVDGGLSPLLECKRLASLQLAGYPAGEEEKILRLVEARSGPSAV